ncbi:nuclear transport factor 2 family protein [Streptomyces hyaluromycini]|uniref:Nuclear transport factor 2 family protein n=1 Tax=Streptomyces hyaluromycini TaxID=1377993 RepID=A0ABV1XBS5_9ACTN
MTINRRSVTTVAALALFGTAGAVGPAVSSSAQPASAATMTAVGLSSHHRLPAVAVDWAAAWNGNDPQRFAALFVKDGSRYTDHAFGRTYTGRDGMAEWFNNTKYFVQNAKIEVTGAFAGRDQVSISWTFSGQLLNAPKPFSVPVATVLQLCGNKILANDDYYNMQEVLLQSGLPADTVFG